MDILLGLAVLIASLILQTTILSNLQILNGTPDLLMLVMIAWGLNESVKVHWEWAIMAGLIVSFVSAMPLFTPLIGYIIVMSMVRLLQTRVWQVPVLAMLLASFAGTIIYQFYTVVVLQYISGTMLDWSISFYRVVLPSALWNVLLAIPVYTLVKDLANWFYRIEETA